MLADGTYLVPDDVENFRDDPRDVRQALEPTYCADLTTGVPLVSHLVSQLRFAKILICSNFLNIGSWTKSLKSQVNILMPDRN